MELTVIENEKLSPIARIIYDGIKQRFEGFLQQFTGGEIARSTGIKMLREEFANSMSLDSGLDDVYAELPNYLKSRENAKILYNFLSENVPKIIDDLENLNPDIRIVF